MSDSIQATARTLTTFEEFCILVREDQKADLLDGVIYMTSPENLEANELAGWLLWVLAGYVEERNLGRVYYSRVAFRLSNHTGPEPDIAFVRRERLNLAKRGYFDGAPDLAMEIVSPESVERDYERIRHLYEKHGVREYWIIDEELQKVTLLQLEPSGQYLESPASEGVLRSAVLPGFFLNPGWLLELPRPARTKTLSLLLETLASGKGV